VGIIRPHCSGPNVNGIKVSLIVSDDLDYGLDLAEALTEAGASVTLYLSQPALAFYLFGAGAPEAVSSPDRLTESLYEKGLLSRGITVRLFRFPRMRDPRSLVAANRLRRMIAGDHPDVVHVLMGPGEFWIAILSCLIRRLPVASTMIIPRPNVGDRLPTSVLWTIAKLLTLGSDLVIVNGADQVDVVRKLYAVSSKKVAYIPLGPRTVAAKWADRLHHEEPGTILFPGKAQARKGLEYLVKAQPIITKCVPHAKIILAAHGEDLDRCRAMIVDQSKFEIHDGFMSAADLANHFQRASLVALPYLSASTSGLLMTAYVFGKPVVATNVGALPEYVKEGVTGYLVPPANAERLGEAIVHLLLDDQLRQLMGKNAKDWMDQEKRKIAAETIKAYERARINFEKG
jgi:alpha-maltose-1-phosphate synthase